LAQGFVSVFTEFERIDEPAGIAQRLARQIA